MTSNLDKIYRRLLITKFFEKGWGQPENLQRLFEFRKIISKRESCYKLIPSDYPVEITNEKTFSDSIVLEGKFLTPLELYLPGVIPPSAREANFQVILPLKWRESKYKPLCIHLAGTGDHYYWRRRNFIVKPLLKEANIGAIILENPFYGLRKPDGQVRSNLHNVSDIFVMGGCLILECLVLLHWCERNDMGPLGITGLSMGGHMASLAATNWPKPLVLIPCLSWSTASSVFTTGVMSHSINWDKLETQYFADGYFNEQLSKMVTVVDDAFSAGQAFIKNFDSSLTQIKNDIKNSRLNKNQLELNNTIYVQNNSSRITKLMNLIVPQKTFTLSEKRNNQFKHFNWWEKEAMQFMRGMMDECTHLKNFSVPYDTSLIIAVCAKDDAYIPRDGCSSLEEIWPGVEVKYVDAGHVSAYVLHQKLFRSCIIEGFSRAKEIYSGYDSTKQNINSTRTYKELYNNYSKLL